MTMTEYSVYGGAFLMLGFGMILLVIGLAWNRWQHKYWWRAYRVTPVKEEEMRAWKPAHRVQALNITLDLAQEGAEKAALREYIITGNPDLLPHMADEDRQGIEAVNEWWDTYGPQSRDYPTYPKRKVGIKPRRSIRWLGLHQPTVVFGAVYVALRVTPGIDPPSSLLIALVIALVSMVPYYLWLKGVV